MFIGGFVLNRGKLVFAYLAFFKLALNDVLMIDVLALGNYFVKGRAARYQFLTEHLLFFG